MESKYSNYIVYVDESGDHNLTDIDEHYPVFVLAFCIFNKEDYCKTIVSKLQKIKFKYFGHDMVVFHEREIRQAIRPFQRLNNQQIRNEFMDDLTNFIQESPFTLISTVINKQRHNEQYLYPQNPYTLSMKFNLERLYKFLEEKGETDLKTYLVFEERGRREDNELELAFRRCCDYDNYLGTNLPFEIIFAKKSVNSCGLQLADLVGRPIGRHQLNPDQGNRAYDAIKPKFRSFNGKIEGYGLKCFP
ncbi:DUF3800 domain-containing protein [Legionella bozemanae]|uniref:3-deoxy-D-manno-octulosonic-acid transferase n=1 Tax=Legionella bozemanae TaxID=447 RepID=A0A0W0RPZ6_LEGBO|nr:DUF3800 domain-containing protein [Legionella bozemanae]KTC73149.1 hypothetical protein Lboz_1795 [Legionella bozemanae]STP14092.1 Protein of uncharacterised function (DUF3800) [Legionella bozemanae]